MIIKKFRAWDTNLKRMWTWEELKNLPMRDFERKDLSWQQFTGRYDIKRNEIYEGDIVKEQNSELDPKPEETLKKIVADIPHIYFEGWVNVSGNVIGNIYENPTLIK
jgi:hypothetical protein